MKTVLHVGCGGSTIERMTAGFQQGWREIRLDINPGVGPDIIGTTLDMNAVASGSVDALYSSHNVEHVETHQVPQMLAEFRRVLKPDGFAVITCPDVEAVAARIAAGELATPLYVSPSGPITALDILFGHGASIAQGEVYMAHRTAFSARTLTDAMTAAGFGMVGTRRRPQAFDLWVVGSPYPIEEDAMRALMRDYCRS